MGGLTTLFTTLIGRAAQRPPMVAAKLPTGYRPAVGQPGKDAVWVPVPQTMLTPMLAMAKVTPRDFVIDLGSGDGRIAIAAAARFGARAVGVEYDPELVALSRHEAHAAGVADRATFVRGDLFETDFSGADVITMYLLPQMIERLRPRLLALRPGTRIVSQTFRVRDWIADRCVVKEGRSAYLWIVPAKVAGEWQLWDEHDAGLRLVLTQQHQFVTGSARCGNVIVKLRNPALSGAQIHFEIATPRDGKREYVGEIDGDNMRGTMFSAAGAAVRWIAQRVS